MAQLLKNPPAMQETWVRSLGWEDSLEKGMATHTYSGLEKSMASQRVGHDWVTFTFTLGLGKLSTLRRLSGSTQPLFWHHMLYIVSLALGKLQFFLGGFMSYKAKTFSKWILSSKEAGWEGEQKSKSFTYYNRVEPVGTFYHKGQPLGFMRNKEDSQ